MSLHWLRFELAPSMLSIFDELDWYGTLSYPSTLTPYKPRHSSLWQLNETRPKQDSMALPPHFPYSTTLSQALWEMVGIYSGCHLSSTGSRCSNPTWRGEQGCSRWYNRNADSQLKAWRFSDHSFWKSLSQLGEGGRLCLLDLIGRPHHSPRRRLFLERRVLRYVAIHTPLGKLESLSMPQLV